MKYGLIGEKLGHSFSKEIHEQIADYTYDLIPLSKTELHDFLTKKDFQAINVTIPYKKDVIPYLDEIDEHAKAIGAVNTIVNRNGRLCGYNTDFTGFAYMVKKHGVSMSGKKVLIIGNGGASAAIQAVVKQQSPKAMLIVDVQVGHGAMSYEECFQNHLDVQIIINTSPIGMYPNINQTPIDLSLFHHCEAVMDVIYNPLTTKLCLEAKKAGMIAVSGLEMLIAQAKYAVEHFLDKRIDDAMIQSIYHKMKLERGNIVFIGMPSAGKTTIAKAIANSLHKTSIDMDEDIVEKAKKSIPEIFSQDSEAVFRSLETEVAYTCASKNGLVIATGGGVVKHAINIDLLKLNGTVFFLDRALDKLISTDSNRPLSSSTEALKVMYQERYPLYQAYADYTIDNNRTVDNAVDSILQTLEK